MIAIRLLRDGAVVREAVFSRLPVRIGRGGENDFVIFEPSVSEAHAVVESGAAGELALRDLSSTNGVYVGPVRVSSVPLRAAVRCRLGLAEIEVESLSLERTAPIDVAQVKRFEQRRTAADHFRYLLIGCLGWLTWVALEPSFWSPWQKTRAVMLLGHAVGILVALPVASFALLAVLKVVGRRVRIADTLQAFGRVVWVLPALLAVSLVTYYLLPESLFGLINAALAFVASIASLTYLAGVRRTGRMTAFRIAWSAVLAVVVIGMSATASLWSRRMGTPDVDYHVQMPLGAVSGPSHGLDAYFDELRAASDSAARDAETVRVRQSNR